MSERVGNYRLVNRIGEGGMGVVYRAEHVVMGRVAAIKILRAEAARENEIVARFFDEARAAHQVGHDAIVEVFDCGVDHDKGPYLVMELLDGESLGDRVAREQRLSLRALAEILEGVAAALDATHTAGIIHRDLKPDNIFLCGADARVKLLDFGVAQLAYLGGARRTQTQHIFGTPVYMSPEQCASAKHVDARTDIYSLGVIAYEALAGRLPFDAEGAGKVMAMHQYERLPDLRGLAPDVPDSAVEAIERALSKAAADRFARASELARALRDAAGGRRVPQTRISGAVDSLRGIPPTLQRADVGADEVTFREVSASPQSRDCPHCHTPLVPTPFDEVEVDRCLSCRGIWLDFGEARCLVEASLVGEDRSLAPALPALLGAHVGEGERDCPNCGERLDVYTLRDEPETEVDRCGLCGGTWLDDGELAMMQRGAAAGLVRELVARGRR